MVAFVTKIAYLSLIYFILKVNPAFSRCTNEQKYIKMVDQILLEVKRSHSLTSHGCYRPFKKASQWKTKNMKYWSISSPLLQNLWYLLRHVDKERECIFDEVEWSRIKDNIRRLQGVRVTKKDQPDVFIIPDVLTQKQCKKLVKIHKEISNSIGSK